MQRVNGKREIEAICDSWQGGLVRYLIWKVKEALKQLENEEKEIGVDDLRDIEDNDGDMNIDDTVDVSDPDGIYDF
jgi:hypothetical protein